MKKILILLLCLCLITVQAFASEVLITEETALYVDEVIISDDPIFEIVIDEEISNDVNLSDTPIIEVDSEEDIVQNTNSYIEEETEAVSDLYIEGETEAVSECYEETSDNIVEVDYNALLHTGEFVVNDGYVNGGADYYTTIQFPYEQQEYLYNLCQEYNVDYAFFLATIYCESLFKPTAYNKNSNGTIDRGLCQVNSGCGKIGFFKEQGWITCLDDLYDPYKCMQCGVYIMSLYTDMFGSVEQAYASYNCGRTDIKSNKNSRRVMRAYEQFAPYFSD